MTEQTNDNTQPDPNDRGLPPGVTNADTGGGSRTDGAPSAPVVDNKPPVDKKAEEEKAKIAEAEAAKAAEEQKQKEADEAKAKETQDKTAVDEVPTEYPSYGDEAADAAVELLKEAQIPVADAYNMFKEAMETGDFSKVPVADLVAKLGKAKADLVMSAVKGYYERTTAVIKDTVDAAYALVGGEANYKKVQEWARVLAGKDAAFAKQAANLNQMFDLNKEAALLATQKLVELYNADKTNSSLTITQITGDSAATNANSAGESISRDVYLAKVKEAHAKNDMQTVRQLQAQRKASMKR